VPETSGRRLGQRQRGALIIPIAAQVDGLALLANNLEAQLVGEEALAFLRARRQQLDV
jgi:hypothetical protein